jgi:hypothetical protein
MRCKGGDRAEGAEAFEALPVAIRYLGPWTGGPGGEVERGVTLTA